MSEKIFILCQDDLGNYEIRYGDKVFHFLCEVAPILNEQQNTIEEQEKIIKKQRKEYINLKENTDALRRTWAKRYKNKKRRVWNY